MTLEYIRAVAGFCDTRFEYIPGAESFELYLNDVRLQLTNSGVVKGGTSHFCSFVYWQLKRNGFSPVMWYVMDVKGDRFFVVACGDYFVSYYDGRIYLSSECPWRLLKKSENLREWITSNTVHSY